MKKFSVVKSSLFQLQPLTLVLLSTLTFVTQIPNFYGEDIVNARENYLIGARTDFWGGVSTLIYSHIPNFGSS